MQRPLDYREDIAKEICDKLKEGMSLRKICENKAYPTKETVFRWLADFPLFQSQYAHAKEFFSDAEFERMYEIIDDADTPEKLAQARLKIDTMKWMLGKMKPKKYGDKLQVGGAEDLPPVRTQSTLNIEGLGVEELEVLQKALLGQNKENGNG